VPLRETGTVVLCREDNAKDVNYKPLAENRERLQGMHLERGASIEVIDLPMPAPLYFDGVRLPASYANFYIANVAVLVPTFNDPKDRIALGILAELFPDRPVVAIHAVDLVWDSARFTVLRSRSRRSSPAPRRRSHPRGSRDRENVGSPGGRKALRRSNASRATFQQLERRAEKDGRLIDRQPRPLMSPRHRPPSSTRAARAAALKASRWRRRWVASHRSHMQRSASTRHPIHRLCGRATSPPSQHSSDVELHSARGRRPPADGLGHCQSAQTDAPERHGTATEGGAQLVQQLAAALVDTDKRGFAHRELLGWCP